MTKILDVDIDEVSDSQMKIPLRCVLHHWWSQRKYQLILTGWHSLTVSTQCTVGWRNCSDKSSTETHSWLGGNAKRCWSPDGTKKKIWHSRAARDNLVAYWPSTQLVEKKQMLRVSRGLSCVNSGERVCGSDSPVREELSTFTGKGRRDECYQWDRGTDSRWHRWKWRKRQWCNAISLVLVIFVTLFWRGNLCH